MRRIRATWWVLALIACSGVRGAEREPVRGVDGKWRRYQSPHFELYSHRADSSSRDLLHNLELLRAVFLDVLGIKEVRPLALSVYYFNDERDFNAYAKSVRLGVPVDGVYLGRPDRAVIIVAPVEDTVESRRVIFHETVHHLSQLVGETPPIWYTEGIAELFSTLEEDKDKLVFGRPVPEHIGYLRTQGMVSLDTLFSYGQSSSVYNEGARTGQLYAESWALLHFWYFGRSKISHAGIDRFLNYVRAEGDNGDRAERWRVFEQAIGMDVNAMTDLLQTYINSGKYSWGTLATPKIAPRSSYVVRPVPIDEMRAELVDLDFKMNRTAATKLALLQAVEKSPWEPHPYELLGSDAAADGDEEAAREWWEKALRAGTKNPAIFHGLAALENRRWFASFDLVYFRMPEEKTDYLRMLLHRSIDAAPDQTEAYEMLAWVEATSEHADVANVNLVQRRLGALSHRSQIMLALALAHIRQKDNESAEAILTALAEREKDEKYQKGIATLRAYMKGKPVEE